MRSTVIGPATHLVLPEGVVRAPLYVRAGRVTWTQPAGDAWENHLAVHLIVPGLAELQRVTRQGGRLLCSDFHPRGAALGWRRADGHRHRDAVRHNPRQHGDWRRVCAALGWRIERTLEPKLEAGDVPAGAHFDPRALETPVALVLQLLKIGR